MSTINNTKLSYRELLVKSMNFLGKNSNVVFLGQSVDYSGNAIFNTLKDIPSKQKIETPVFEDTQMGISIGLALEGFIPITCYPRFDFLICAMNQLCNHLDNIKYLTSRDDLKVIIRTSIGSKIPLDGGPQHTKDHTNGLKKILKNINIIKLDNKNKIMKSYKDAIKRKGSFLIIEYGDYYNK